MKLLPLLLLLASCGVSTTHYSNVYIESSTQDNQTLYTERGTFVYPNSQEPLEGKTCSFEALGEIIIPETLQCKGK